MNTPATRRWAALAGPFAALLALLVPTAARANIGPKWWGDRTAEPLGLRGVAITHEQLTIDMRPLAALEPVRVEVVYHLHNSGAAKKLDLLFVTGATGVSNFEVRQGDLLLESSRVTRPGQPGDPEAMLRNWEPPDELPGIDSRATRSHIHRRAVNVLLAFSVEVPAGASTLRARYRARAYGEDEDYPTVTWQFPYILAPAREWARLDRLDVTVYVPDGWQSVSEPALQREGAVLRGDFSGVPRDCLAVAVRAPAPPDLQAIIGRYLALYGIMVVGGGVVCRLTVRLLARLLAGGGGLGRPPFVVISLGLVLALLWPAAVWWAAWLTREGIWGALGGQESPYFHEPFFLLTLVTLVLLPVTLLGGLILAFGAFRTRRGAAVPPAST